MVCWANVAVIEGAAALPDCVDEAVPFELAYWPDLRASSEDVDANVDEDAALVPELREGAESDDDDAELDTPELVRELIDEDAAVALARGADTLFVCGTLPPGAV